MTFTLTSNDLMIIAGIAFVLITAITILYLSYRYREKRYLDLLNQKRKQLEFNETLLISKLEIQEQLLMRSSTILKSSIMEFASQIDSGLEIIKKDHPDFQSRNIAETEFLVSVLKDQLKRMVSFAGSLLLVLRL